MSDAEAKVPARWERLTERLETRLERIDDRADRMADKIEDRAEKGRPIPEARQDRMESRIESQLDRLEARLEKILSKRPELADWVAEMREKIDAARDKVDAVFNPEPAPPTPDAPAPEEPAPEPPAPEPPAPDDPDGSTPAPEDPPKDEPVQEEPRENDPAPDAPDAPDDGSPAPEPPSGDQPAPGTPPPPPEDPVSEAPAAPPPDAPADPTPPPPPPSYSAADFTGKGQVVVVIDSGWNDQFLSASEEPIFEYDFFSRDSVAKVGHNNDHGSWVDQVVRDVASGVSTIHLKVFPDGSGGAPLSVVEDALQWVVDNTANYDIAAVNLSLGYGNTTRTTPGMLSDEFAALDAAGVMSVVAAGNSGQEGVQFLAADPNVVAVSASTSAGSKAGFSQADEDLTDIFAFGQSVRIDDELGGGNVVSGTSFAAPYVSAVAARLQEASNVIGGRDLSDDEFVDIMQKSGSDLNGYAGDDAPAGYHIADADAAVQYLIDNSGDYFAFV